MEVWDIQLQLYLDLVFDYKLSWDSQASNVCKKMSLLTATHLLNCQGHAVSSDRLKRLLVDSLRFDLRFVC